MFIRWEVSTKRHLAVSEKAKSNSSMSLKKKEEKHFQSQHK